MAKKTKKKSDEKRQRKHVEAAPNPFEFRKEKNKGGKVLGKTMQGTQKAGGQSRSQGVTKV